MFLILIVVALGVVYQQAISRLSGSSRRPLDEDDVMEYLNPENLALDPDEDELERLESMEELKESYKSELNVSNSKLAHLCKHKEYVKYIQNNKRTLPVKIWLS